jgi:NAD(P)-dependent dehydrogenase (short-subunit alcohol dehydrogenase family)
MTGRVALITEGSRGIGAGLVTAYRARGWAVVATGQTIRSSPDPDLLTVAGDITEPLTAQRVIDSALERFGRLDTLVNNAGVFSSEPAGVNLTGFFWLTQRAIADMATRYGGHVVTITATMAEGTNAGSPAVPSALSTGGLTAATRSLAIEYAAHGIRINAVSAGVIQIPIHGAESYQALGDRVCPLGLPGQVSDVVDGVLFLEFSPFITGEILHIDGGWRAGHEVPG